MSEGSSSPQICPMLLWHAGGGVVTPTLRCHRLRRWRHWHTHRGVVSTDLIPVAQRGDRVMGASQPAGRRAGDFPQDAAAAAAMAADEDMLGGQRASL